jgi:hypothetical protein
MSSAAGHDIVSFAAGSVIPLESRSPIGDPESAVR